MIADGVRIERMLPSGCVVVARRVVITGKIACHGIIPGSGVVAAFVRIEIRVCQGIGPHRCVIHGVAAHRIPSSR